jgi:predicted MPP superfamily phosphohydrolase
MSRCTSSPAPCSAPPRRGAACLAYSAGYEVRSFRLRRLTVPVLAPGQPPLRVLQITDLHMTPGQHRKQEWVRRLAALKPDLVLDTGDNLAHLEAVPSVLHALEPLLELPGAFVFGLQRHLRAGAQEPGAVPAARHRRAHARQRAALARPARLDALGRLGRPHQRARPGQGRRSREVELVGVDDPHIWRDRYDAVQGPASHDVDLSLGVVHAPYHRVVDRMAADGLPLVIAGHTHGGQLRVPFYGALVSNCDLDPKRARGLSRHTDSTLLHVSAGLGTSPYTPVRFACPPEATLLTLVAPTERARGNRSLGGRRWLGYPARAPSGCSAAW